MTLSKYFGDRKFMKSALVIAIPVIIQQLISSSVHLIDNLMVGSLGDAALGGVGSANRFYMIAMFGMFGISAAGSVFIAQYYGAKNQGRMKESFRFVVLALLAIALLFFLVSFLFPENILRFFTSDETTIQLGVDYFSIAAFTYVPLALILAISGSMRSIGEIKLPLYVSSASVLVNTVLNYGLIFGNFGLPELGIKGAGYATLCARLFEVVVFLYFLKKGDYLFKTKVKNLFKVSKAISRKIFIKALPLMANEVAWSSGMAFLYMLYSSAGTEIMAGFSAASTVADIFFVAFSGMATTSTVLIAHPLGANKLDEAKQNGYHLIGFSILLAATCGIFMFIASYFVPMLYKDLSSEALAFAMIMLRIQSVMLVFYMISAQNYFILRAGGDTLSTFIFDSCFMWIVNIPFVASLVYFTPLPIHIIFLLGQLIEFFKIAMGAYFVRKEKWVHNLAHEDQEIINEI